MTHFLGVDPGKGGAVASVDHEGRLVFVRATPMVASARNRPDYDLPAIVRLVREAEPRVVFVEELLPMPSHVGGGSIANFARGLAHGWAWMLTALEVPFVLVAPRTWQKAMLAEGPAGETGQRSIVAAQRLWPGFEFKRSARAVKLDDGLTDAALLAEFGRRRLIGLDGRSETSA